MSDNCTIDDITIVGVAKWSATIEYGEVEIKDTVDATPEHYICKNCGVKLIKKEVKEHINHD